MMPILLLLSYYKPTLGILKMAEIITFFGWAAIYNQPLEPWHPTGALEGV